MQNAIVSHLRVMFHNGSALSELQAEMNGVSNPPQLPQTQKTAAYVPGGENMRLLTFCYKSAVSSALTAGWTVPVNSSITSTHL